MVRIPGFHPGDPGSIPGRGNNLPSLVEAMAQLAARRIPDPKVGGSNPSSLNIIFCIKLYHISGLGLVGYDDCLTRSRSRVRFSEPVMIHALIVQWLEYFVANEVARVRFSVSANIFYYFFLTR